MVQYDASDETRIREIQQAWQTAGHNAATIARSILSACGRRKPGLPLVKMIAEAAAHCAANGPNVSRAELARALAIIERGVATEQITNGGGYFRLVARELYAIDGYDLESDLKRKQA